MADRARRFKGKWVRRAVQLVSLALFVVLAVATPLLSLSWSASQLFSRLDPLIGATVVIASRVWVGYALLGIITLLLALILGRAWCGWVCPLGTLLDIAPARSRTKASLPGWWRFGKYVTFSVIIIAAAMGTTAPMMLDPVTIVLRPLQEFIMPQVGTDAVGQAVGTYLSRDAIGMLAVFSLLPLAIILGLNAVADRFWCTSLCPLGGMLGLVSRFALIRRRVDTETCIECGKCARECPTSAIDADAQYASSSSECVTCLHCSDICPTRANSFGAAKTLRSPTSFDPEKREGLVLLGVTGASVAATLMLPRVLGDEEILRPPSTDEQRLADLCVRCGACYSACPTGVLRPSTAAFSESGLWTPMLDERPQHCTMECNLCAGRCPTDALHTPTYLEARQLGLGKVAEVNYNGCAAAVRGEECMRCRGSCPINGAITAQEHTVVWHGREKTVPIPIVVEELCVACGVCTDVCPVDPPAIVVRG